MFDFTFGEPGSGKSIAQAELVLELLKRSVKIEKKYKGKVKEMTFPREVWCNFHLSPNLTAKYKDRLVLWHNWEQMVFTDYPKNSIVRRNFDCIWDEIAVEIPADRWKDTDLELRRFFAQHRKRGIEIYANSQDWKMVDINARRMIHRVHETIKVLGSRDPSATLPPIQKPWGIILKWDIDKELIKESQAEKKKVGFLPGLTFISKKLVNAYDTTEDIAATERILKHSTRKCGICNFERTFHS